MTTALVLAGGGARGAYEAGALSVLLPALEKRGERPSLFVGTSVGAINASFLAASGHLPAADAVDGLVELWRGLTKGQVIRPIASRQGPLAALRYAGELFSLPGVRLESLLDPEPLKGNLEHWIDWEQLGANIDEGIVDTLAVVATSARTGRSVVFADEHEGRVHHRSHAVAYAPLPRSRCSSLRSASRSRRPRAAGTSMAARGSTPRSSQRSTSVPTGWWWWPATRSPVRSWTPTPTPGRTRPTSATACCTCSRGRWSIR